MMAAVAVGWSGYVRRPAWACVIYLYTDSTRTLALDGQALSFGYEVLTSGPDEPVTALVERLDEILVACRRHAKILAGHDLAKNLASLATFGVHRRLPGVGGVRQQWSARQSRERATAKAIDTAHDIDQPGVTDLALLCERTALLINSICANDTAAIQEMVVRRLAVALLAARAAGRYDWTAPVDLNQLATDAAWDQLAQLQDSLSL